MISKAKMYGFNPWMDQLDAINQIMAETGEKSESAILRKLIDEALTARRAKAAHSTPSDSAASDSGASKATPSATQTGSAETLATIQTLLLKLILQGETSLRMQDICLALLQDTLAEAHAGRKITWDNLAILALKEKGVTTSEIAKQFKSQTDQARNYAYSVAQNIKTSGRDKEKSLPPG